MVLYGNHNNWQPNHDEDSHRVRARRPTNLAVAPGRRARGFGFQHPRLPQPQPLFDTCRDSDAGLIVIAQPDPAGAVRACRVTDNIASIPIMVVMPRESDLIPVLDAGADDAVVARAEPAVFIARVRALLRRTQPATSANNTIGIRDLTINLERYHVYLQGELINLTPTEFRILAVLAKQAGRVIDLARCSPCAPARYSEGRANRSGAHR
jgi:hypothetical protein